MTTVSIACASCSRGLFTSSRWGWHLALAMVGVNLIGDTLNALLLGDLTTLIGLPIGGTLIAYLLSRKVRNAFAGH